MKTKRLSRKTWLSLVLSALIAFEPTLVFAGEAVRKQGRHPASATVTPIQRKPIDKAAVIKDIQESVGAVKKTRDKETVFEVLRRIGRQLGPEELRFVTEFASGQGTKVFPNVRFKNGIVTSSLNGQSASMEFVLTDEVYVKIGREKISRTEFEDLTLLDRRLREIFKLPKEQPAAVDEASLYHLLVPEAHAMALALIPLGLAVFVGFMMLKKNKENQRLQQATAAAAAYAARCPATQRCCQTATNTYAYHSNFCCEELGSGVVGADAYLCANPPAAPANKTTNQNREK